MVNREGGMADGNYVRGLERAGRLFSYQEPGRRTGGKGGELEP